MEKSRASSEFILLLSQVRSDTFTVRAYGESADTDSGEAVKFSSSVYFKDEQSRQIVFCPHVQGAKRPKVAPICIYDQPKVPEPQEPVEKP